jgi:hypothetical protein
MWLWLVMRVVLQGLILRVRVLELRDNLTLWMDVLRGILRAQELKHDY